LPMADPLQPGCAIPRENWLFRRGAVG
jgi:hypothetical protein